MLHTLSVSPDNHTPFNLPQFLKYLDVPITQEFEGTEGNATFYYLQPVSYTHLTLPTNSLV